MPAAERPASPVTEQEAENLFATLDRTAAHVALAVSGGGDSIALMVLAARWAQRHGGSPKLTVLTVDHGLRPEAEAEARQVAEWAAALGLDAHILTWTGLKPATGLQAAAREARYRLMGEWCRSHGATALLTAHTLDDQAETFLMRLARGSGINGLASMPEHSLGSPRIERPLLSVSRERLRATLRAAKHPWIEDPSNQDETFERVRIRKAMPELAKLGLTAVAIGLSARRLNRAREPLLRLSFDFVRKQVEIRAEGFGIVERDKFGSLAEEVQVHVLQSLLEQFGGMDEPPRLMAVEALIDWINRSEEPARTLAGCHVVRQASTFLIGREPGRISRLPVPVPSDGEILWDGRFSVAVAGARASCVIIPVGAVAGIARQKSLPAFVQASLPAILIEGQFGIVPQLGLRTDAVPPELAVTARFRGGRSSGLHLR